MADRWRSTALAAIWSRAPGSAILGCSTRPCAPWALPLRCGALIALPETLLGQNFTHDALRALTGYVHPTAVETRLGLTRAYGTFDHPIHYGTFCAALLAQFWYAAKSTMEKRKRAALLAGATLLGLSSAPILCLLLQTAMLLWEYLTRGTANRTSLTLTVLAGLYIGASFVMTRSPINFIATGMTLDSWTGYYRSADLGTRPR